jgi:hypothetical protein
VGCVIHLGKTYLTNRVKRLSFNRQLTAKCNVANRNTQPISGVQPGRLRQVRHQKFHLVRQDAAVAQDEVFPQAGNIRRVQERHVRLLGGAAAFAVVAGAAGGDHVHPRVDAILSERNDVLARQNLFMEVLAAVGADIAVARKEFAVGQAWLEIEGVDAGHALRADDAVDGDERLLARHGVVAAPEQRHLRAHLPTHLTGSVVEYGLLKADPRLWQPLGGELQDLQSNLHEHGNRLVVKLGCQGRTPCSSSIYRDSLTTG